MLIALRGLAVFALLAGSCAAQAVSPSVGALHANGKTFNGMRINGRAFDIDDRYGIQVAADNTSLSFEAGWSAQAAVCVAHTRVAEELDLDALAQRGPHLKQALGVRCDEERAASLGAVVFNRSR